MKMTIEELKNNLKDRKKNLEEMLDSNIDGITREECEEVISLNAKIEEVDSVLKLLKIRK
jgi:hypothetical protein